MSYHVVLGIRTVSHLLQAEYALIIKDIRELFLKSCRRRTAVEVDEKLVFCGNAGRFKHNVLDSLVIALEKVYLETLHSHCSVMLAHLLNVFNKGRIACPEDDAHILFLPVADYFFKVDFGHYVK